MGMVTIKSHLAMTTPPATTSPWVTTMAVTSTMIMSTAAAMMSWVDGNTITGPITLSVREHRGLQVLLSLGNWIGGFNRVYIAERCSFDTLNYYRYFSTSGRTDSAIDIGSRGATDFRHYNYRSVPYYGAADNYHNLNKIFLEQNRREGRAF